MRNKGGTMDIKSILKKINEPEKPKVKKVIIAYSGGLDSSLGLALLKHVYKAEEILAVTLDIGQGEDEIKMAMEKAKKLDISPKLIDKKKEFTEEWIALAIMANSDYLGYPVSTSMTRQIIAKEVAIIGTKEGCDAVLEGSSGKGNDQYRMHNVFKLFAPELNVLVPVRDFDLSRAEEEELCRYWGIPITETIRGGDDKTMWCRSIASGAIEINQELPSDIWMWYVPPEKANEKGEILEIEFKEGIPISLNGSKAPLSEIVPSLNTIGGRNGIGKIDIIEDGIMDLKSREIYEAPAAKILLTLHRDLEQLCLTKDEVQFKKGIDQIWAYLIYHGKAFHPLKEDLDAFIRQSQKVVNGKYKVLLYKGNIEIISRESDSSLFYPEIRSIKTGGFDQRICANAAKIMGLPFEILAKRKEKIRS